MITTAALDTFVYWRLPWTNKSQEASSTFAQLLLLLFYYYYDDAY